MGQPKCVAFVDPTRLTSSQSADLEFGMAVILAFWTTVASHPVWRTSSEWPINRCIFVALCVRDMLHAAGRTDAKFMRSGFHLRQLSGEIPYQLTIGSPAARRIKKGWNAHAIVTLGDILLDPTHGQTCRLWNHSPHAAALLIAPSEEDAIEIEPGCTVSVTTMHRYWAEGKHYQMAYFKLPYSVDLRTRNWRNSPDVKPERRRSLVQAANATFLARLEGMSNAA